MITEKWLNLTELQLNKFDDHEILQNRQEGLELIRLARLGLWAEKHAIPALKEFSRKAVIEEQSPILEKLSDTGGGISLHEGESPSAVHQFASEEFLKRKERDCR